MPLQTNHQGFLGCGLADGSPLKYAIRTSAFSVAGQALWGLCALSPHRLPWVRCPCPVGLREGPVRSGPSPSLRVSSPWEGQHQGPLGACLSRLEPHRPGGAPLPLAPPAEPQGLRQARWSLLLTLPISSRQTHEGWWEARNSIPPTGLPGPPSKLMNQNGCHLEQSEKMPSVIKKLLF